ncbi:MAG: hypothetical protein ABN483_04080, partial [Pantoea agglomerans]
AARQQARCQQPTHIANSERTNGGNRHYAHLLQTRIGILSSHRLTSCRLQPHTNALTHTYFNKKIKSNSLRGELQRCEHAQINSDMA